MLIKRQQDKSTKEKESKYTENDNHKSVLYSPSNGNVIFAHVVSLSHDAFQRRAASLNFQREITNVSFYFCCFVGYF